MIGYSIREFVCPFYIANKRARHYIFSVSLADEEVKHDLDEEQPKEKTKTFIRNPKFLEEIQWFFETHKDLIDKLDNQFDDQGEVFIGENLPMPQETTTDVMVYDEMFNDYD